MVAAQRAASLERRQRTPSARTIGRMADATYFAWFEIFVSCHRVPAAGGAGGSFSATGGVSTKLRLPEIERASFGAQPSLFDAGS
jgi:methylated-DNA-[protein]-cysteine S-methyltransferase